MGGGDDLQSPVLVPKGRCARSSPTATTVRGDDADPDIWRGSGTVQADCGDTDECEGGRGGGKCMLMLQEIGG